MDNNVTILIWDPKALNDEGVQRENKGVSTLEVKKESKWVSEKNEGRMSESWSVKHVEYIQASAVESVKLVSATAGYIRLFFSVVKL